MQYTKYLGCFNLSGQFYSVILNIYYKSKIECLTGIDSALTFLIQAAYVSLTHSLNTQCSSDWTIHHCSPTITNVSPLKPTDGDCSDGLDRGCLFLELNHQGLCSKVWRWLWRSGAGGGTGSNATSRLAIPYFCGFGKSNSRRSSEV